MVGKKAYVGMAVANALLLGLVACTFLFFNARLNTKLEEVTKRDQAVLRSLNEIDSAALVTSHATRSIFIDPQDATAREAYQTACDRFAKAYGAALALSAGDVKGKLANIKAGWDEDDGLKRQAQALAADGKKRGGGGTAGNQAGNRQQGIARCRRHGGGGPGNAVTHRRHLLRNSHKDGRNRDPRGCVRGLHPLLPLFVSVL